MENQDDHFGHEHGNPAPPLAELEQDPERDHQMREDDDQDPERDHQIVDLTLDDDAFAS